jgi:hypothetical protein
VIAEKNVFNPDRKEFSTAAAAAMSKPISRPQVTLQGFVLAEGYQSASIVNPGRPLHKGERETKSMRIGDMVGEYKLSKILPDRILLEAGEDSFEVLLYDPRSPKKRVEVKTATAGCHHFLGRRFAGTRRSAGRPALSAPLRHSPRSPSRSRAWAPRRLAGAGAGVPRFRPGSPAASRSGPGARGRRRTHGRVRVKNQA